MDDAKIAELTAEVLADLRAPSAPPAGASGSRITSLEARVAELEAVVRALAATPPVTAVAVAATGTSPAPRASHPSLQLLSVPGRTERCVMEPDKPCVSSGLCRTFGH